MDKPAFDYMKILTNSKYMKILTNNNPPEIELTEDTIQQARQYFAELYLQRIENIKKGNYINYNEDMEKAIKGYEDVLAGKYDCNSNFVQYAIFVQTGIYYPLLPM